MPHSLVFSIKGIFKLSLFLLLVILSVNLQAQTARFDSTAQVKEITNAFLPALGYNSDIGFVGGGLYNRYVYENESPQFSSYLSSSAQLSSKGLFAGELSLDIPELHKSGIIFYGELYATRFFEDQYFGYANYGNLNDFNEPNENYYLFNSFSTGIMMRLGAPIKVFPISNFEWFGSLNFEYQTPTGDNSNRLIGEITPPGYDGSQLLLFGFGLRNDSRSNQFRPKNGFYFEAAAEVASEAFASSNDVIIFKSKFSTYYTFQFIREITFANQVQFYKSEGETPYWKQASVGGSETLRGYPFRRFLDQNSLVMNTELRTWLFKVPVLESEFGGTLFMDIGRTFPNGTSLSDFMGDLKFTGGFGGTSSFFTPDFVMRADIGFSEEGIGIYLTGGYAF